MQYVVSNQIHMGSSTNNNSSKTGLTLRQSSLSGLRHLSHTLIAVGFIYKTYNVSVFLHHITTSAMLALSILWRRVPGPKVTAAPLHLPFSPVPWPPLFVLGTVGVGVWGRMPGKLLQMVVEGHGKAVLKCRGWIFLLKKREQGFSWAEGPTRS